MRIGSREITLTRQGKIVFGTLGIIILAGGGYFSWQFTKKSEVDKLPFLEKVTGPEAEKKAVDIAYEVAKLIELPAGETPSLATVTGVETLRNQEFYRNAQDGDKVLIYQKAHMAYLYRPSTGKLINVMAATFEAEEQEKKAKQLSEVASASDAATLVVTATPSATITPTPITSAR